MRPAQLKVTPPPTHPPTVFVPPHQGKDGLAKKLFCCTTSSIKFGNSKVLNNRWEEFALTIGTVSILSFNPLSLAARSLTEGTTSNDELPTAPPTGVYGCARLMPLVGELAGTKDPSEMGTSAGSLAKVLRRGGSGTRDLPLSFRSSSARLVLALMRLLTRGL